MKETFNQLIYSILYYENILTEYYFKYHDEEAYTILLKIRDFSKEIVEDKYKDE